LIARLGLLLKGENMTKFMKFLAVPLFLLVFVVVSGMSARDENAPQKIPEPLKNFSVIIEDQAGVKTKVSLFSINGATYLSGEMGKGSYSIPFENIKEVEFRYTDDKLEAIAYLVKGDPVNLRPNKSLNCYGRTEFGSYLIKLGDIRKLVIEGRLVPQT